MTDELSVEASGETVGEAKWSALRELERLAPGLDRDAVRFQVVTRGRARPARGRLRAGPRRRDGGAAGGAAAAAPIEAGEAAVARELLVRVLATIGVARHRRRSTSARTRCAPPSPAATSVSSSAATAR